MRFSGGDVRGAPVRGGGIFAGLLAIAVCLAACASKPEQPATANEMVFIQGGTFTMGSPPEEKDREDNETQHSVTVSSFYMGRTEVTQKDYKAVMGRNPGEYKGDDLPVENVTWFNAVQYCNARSRKEGLTPAYKIFFTRVTWNKAANGYRLPTEAEWEYACRAGTETAFNTGNSITASQANFNGSGDVFHKGGEKGVYLGTPAAAGSYPPNAWGLYDMHGNVEEWCWDWYEWYDSESQTDPSGPPGTSTKWHVEISGGFVTLSTEHRLKYRIMRGGGWGNLARSLRSAYRYGGVPSLIRSWVESGVGFRLARNAG